MLFRSDNDSTTRPPGIPPGAFSDGGATCYSTAGGRIEESVVFELNGDSTDSLCGER